MRILLVTDGIYPFMMGGMQKHSFYLGKFLSRSGHRVHLVHCAENIAAGSELERPEFSGFDASNITFQRVPFPRESRFPGHYLRASRRYSRLVYAAVKDRLGEYDAIYCQGFTATAFIQGRERGAVRIPVLSNLHGYEMFQRAPSLRVAAGQPALRRIARRISLGSDAVFSFGGRITDILRGMGVAGERILECPIGIEERWLAGDIAGSGGPGRTFVFIGRNERRKGLLEFTLALKRMIAEGRTGFHVHIIGPIDERGRLKSDCITYHGAMTEERGIREVLRASDVLVCPSYAEGMPTVIMEAMASGLAIIATDVGAVRQQVDRNGWLIGAPEGTAIQGAMEEALRIPAQQLAAMKARSLAKVVQDFTWERVIERKAGLIAGFLAQALPKNAGGGH